MHPSPFCCLRALLFSKGFDLAKTSLLEYLETVKAPVDTSDRELLSCVAKTSLRTKLSQVLADQFTDIVTDAVLCVKKPDEPIDLHMVSHPRNISRDAVRY